MRAGRILSCSLATTSSSPRERGEGGGKGGRGEEREGAREGAWEEAREGAREGSPSLPSLPGSMGDVNVLY